MPACPQHRRSRGNTSCFPASTPHHPHTLRPPRPSLTTAETIAPVHVELAPRRREAVTVSGKRRGAAEGGGEVCPGPGGRIVHVEVVDVDWYGRAGGRTAARQSHAGRASRLRTHALLTAAAACKTAEYPAPPRRLKRPTITSASPCNPRYPLRAAPPTCPSCTRPRINEHAYDARARKRPNAHYAHRSRRVYMHGCTDEWETRSAGSVLLLPLSDPLTASILRWRSGHDCCFSVTPPGSLRCPYPADPLLASPSTVFCTPELENCAGRELEERWRRGHESGLAHMYVDSQPRSVYCDSLASLETG
jgi:hypothetical protein